MLLGGIALAVFAEVISRYVFHVTHGVMEELNPNAMVWIAFLGAGLLVKANRHIRMEIVRGRFGEDSAKKGIVDLIGYIFEIALLSYVGWAGVDRVFSAYELGIVSNTEVTYPYWVVSIIVPLGCFLLVIESVEQLIKSATAVRGARGGQR